MRARFDQDIIRLNAATVEYSRIRGEIEAKLQAAYSSVGLTNISAADNDFRAAHANEFCAAKSAASLPSTDSLSLPVPYDSGYDSLLDADTVLVDSNLERKEDLITIVDLVSSSQQSDQLDGMLLLGIFFEENKTAINWDGLHALFLEVLRFIPDNDDEPQIYVKSNETYLILDAACFCVSEMCGNSVSILEKARSLNIVPRVLQLLKYVKLNTYLMKQCGNDLHRHEDAALRNTACRALIVLTDSIEDLKHFLINHDVTRDVLLQQMSSFDDELKSIFCCVCARCFGFTIQHFRSCCHDLACKIGVWMRTKYQSESVHGRLVACCFGMHIEDAISSACRSRFLYFTVQFTRRM
jgi:hypothetical protein